MPAEAADLVRHVSQVEKRDQVGGQALAAVPTNRLVAVNREKAWSFLGGVAGAARRATRFTGFAGILDGEALHRCT